MEEKDKKKYIAFGIGIAILLILIIILLIVKKSNSGSSKFSAEIVCTPVKISNIKKWTFNIKNGKIKTTKLEMMEDYANYGYELAEDVIPETQNEIKSLVLKDLMLSSEKEEGINLNIYFDNNVNIDINIDYDKANKEKLEYMGLNFEGNIDFNNFVEYVDNYGNGTFKCKKISND